jgi:hypothetical protein
MPGDLNVGGSASVAGRLVNPGGLVSYRIDNIVSPNTSPSNIELTPAQCPFLNDNSVSYILGTLIPNGTGGTNSAQFNTSFLNFSLVGQRQVSPGGIIWSEFSIIPLPGTLGQPALVITTTGTGLNLRYGLRFDGVTQATSYSFSVTIFNKMVLTPPNLTPIGP